MRNGERIVIFAHIPINLCKVPDFRMGSRWQSNTENELIKHSALPSRGSHFSVVFVGKMGD